MADSWMRLSVPHSDLQAIGMGPFRFSARWLRMSPPGFNIRPHETKIEGTSVKRMCVISAPIWSHLGLADLAIPSPSWRGAAVSSEQRGRVGLESGYRLSGPIRVTLEA